MNTNSDAFTRVICEYCPSGLPSASGLKISIWGMVASASIWFVLIVAQMICAEYVRIAHGFRLTDIGLVEFPHAFAAHQAKVAAHLVFQQFQHAHDAGPAGGGKRVAIEPPDSDRGRAHGDRLQHIGRAIERAVNDDRHFSFHDLHDLRKDFHGAARMVERASAVIGDVNASNPMLEAKLRVFGGLDALDDDLRLREPFLEALDRAPVETREIAMLFGAAVGDAV